MLSPNEILRFWQQTHQYLDSSSGPRFLGKLEIPQLAILPGFHVRQAIREHAKLEKALAMALSTAIEDDSLTESEQMNLASASISDALYCEHKLRTFDKCEDCRPIRPILRQKEVWLSAGGGKFHYDRNCPFAQQGQEAFRDRGGTALHWYSASENLVKWDRAPCRGCVIQHPLNFSWLDE